MSACSTGSMFVSSSFPSRESTIAYSGLLIFSTAILPSFFCKRVSSNDHIGAVSDFLDFSSGVTHLHLSNGIQERLSVHIKVFKDRDEVDVFFFLCWSSRILRHNHKVSVIPFFNACVTFKRKVRVRPPNVKVVYSPILLKYAFVCSAIVLLLSK